MPSNLMLALLVWHRPQTQYPWSLVNYQRTGLRKSCRAPKPLPSCKTNQHPYISTIPTHVSNCHRILTVVDSIGSSLLAQLNGSDQISSCQDGIFLLAKRVRCLPIPCSPVIEAVHAYIQVAPSSKGASDLSLNTDSNCARNSDSNMASVLVPKSLFDQDNEGISILFVLFNSSSLFPDTSTNNLTVNSAVIGISINNYTQLSENITIHFQLQRSVSSLIFEIPFPFSNHNFLQSNEVQCVFYDCELNRDRLLR